GGSRRGDDDGLPFARGGAARRGPRHPRPAAQAARGAVAARGALGGTPATASLSGDGAIARRDPPGGWAADARVVSSRTNRRPAVPGRPQSALLVEVLLSRA